MLEAGGGATLGGSANRYGRSLAGDGNVLNETVVMVIQQGESTKNTDGTLSNSEVYVM